MMVKNHNHLGVALAAAAAGVLAAVGMLMLMLVVVGVEPAGAAFPGQNGKIAFTSDRDDDKGDLYTATEIYTMNSDGTGDPDRLTTNPARDEDPAWQPLQRGPGVCLPPTCR